MYKSKILAILILAFVTGTVKAASLLMTVRNGGQSTEVFVESEPVQTVPSRENYKRFMSSIETLESQIGKITDTRSRVSYLHKRLTEIENEREKWEYSAVEDEIAMDLVVGTLKLIPEIENFRTEDCDDYQTNVFVSYDPTSGHLKVPREPSVKKAFGIFKKICQ